MIQNISLSQFKISLSRRCLIFLGFKGLLMLMIVMGGVEIRAEEELLEKIYYYVNDDIITKLDFEEAYQLARQDPTLKSLSQSALSNAVISNLISERSISYHAELEGIRVREGDVESEVNQLMQVNNIRSREQFDLMLSAQGINKTVFEQQIKKKLLIQKYVSSKIDVKLPQDDEVKAYYETHKETIFKVKNPVYYLSWVFFENNNRKTFSERKAIQIRADKVRNDVLTGVLTFEKAVSEYSEDEVSRANRGLLGWKKSESLPVNNAALDEMSTLVKGDITSLYSSETGVFFYKIEDVLKQGYIPYEVAIQEIRELIVKEYREKAFQDIIANLHKLSYIKKNVDEFDIEF